MKIGIVGYTNKASGIGLLIHDLFHYLGDENASILSVDAGIKGQEVWTERQLTVRRPPSNKAITTYFDKFEPTHVIFIETPFAEALYPLAKQRGIKTIGIPMHETFSAYRLNADLLICPCYSAWEKAGGNKTLLFLPIGLKMFPFKLRTGHTFVCNIGYGGPHDRRQSAVIVKAFTLLDDPDARLILNYQGRQWPEGTQVDDPRISYFQGTKENPAELYEEGDVAIFPMAYGGYERPILESMASGMPCLTTNADPMNLFQHDPDFLIEPSNPWLIRNSQWVQNTIFNQISVEDLLEKMEWLLKLPTGKYSLWARAQAEAQSWESKDFDFKKTWLEALESA